MAAYEGVLRGNSIEWRNGAPPGLASDQPVKVYVTLAERLGSSENAPDRGQRMAAALEHLAALRPAIAIEDPMQWEREMRRERPLPNRDP